MAAKKTKNEATQIESQARDLERIENHLNYNPWLRGIYDEAKSIAALDRDAVLEPALSESDLSDRADVMRYGDYEYKGQADKVLINHDANAVPEAYFSFLFLIGGFKCRSVELYHLGYDYMHIKCVRGYNDSPQKGPTIPIAVVEGSSVREIVTTGTIHNAYSEYSASYPIQITLGRCDHGEYVYDRRYDGYSLIGFGNVTNFNNCGEMLNHAMYRARENIRENWTSADKPKAGSRGKKK